MAKELKRRDLSGIFIFDTFPGESHRPHRHRLPRRARHDAGREGRQHHRRALAHHRAEGDDTLHRPQPCHYHRPHRPTLSGRGNHHAAHADARKRITSKYKELWNQ